jgi:trehalose synthase
MRRKFRLIGIDDYENYIGQKSADRIREKAKNLQNSSVVHLNSTLYGGGVAVLLDSLTLLMNSLGIRTEWRVIQGAPDFFSITKKIHNALQGGRIRLTGIKKAIYEDINYKNAIRSHLDEYDYVVIHDPQPLALIEYSAKKCPWIWRCHIDLTSPSPDIWNYLLSFIEKYDAAIFSIPDYRQNLKIPQLFFLPAIDPFSITNQEITEHQILERLERYNIPTDLPLVVQISRFDRWKDPEGVIRAFKIARRKVPATLVLVGNIATDDPEGERVHQALLDSREERIIILSVEDTALVNALQRYAAVVLQKSIREGFGLTVSEALWKGTPVIGGNVGGIRYQIQNGVNGYLVSSVEEASTRMIELLENKKLRDKMGKKGKEIVRERFLLTRLLEQYLDLFNAFKTYYILKDKHQIQVPVKTA